jgi:NAD(P)-dependent dehydrogenase (short-subunit alcohol dehydrogenase family)
MTFDLELGNRRALVTGGTKGVGAAVVQVLRDAGVKVVTTARSVPSDPILGVRYVSADLSTAPGCAKVAAAVLQEFRGIDVIVHVVGGSSAPGGGFAALDDDEWTKEINQNLLPAVRLGTALLPSMINGARVIIHVTRYSINWLPGRRLPMPREEAALSTAASFCQGGDAEGDRWSGLARFIETEAAVRCAASRGASGTSTRRQTDHHEGFRAAPRPSAKTNRGRRADCFLVFAAASITDRIRDRWRQFPFMSASPARCARPTASAMPADRSSSANKRLYTFGQLHASLNRTASAASFLPRSTPWLVLRRDQN